MKGEGFTGEIGEQNRRTKGLVERNRGDFLTFPGFRRRINILAYTLLSISLAGKEGGGKGRESVRDRDRKYLSALSSGLLVRPVGTISLCSGLLRMLATNVKEGLNALGVLG